MIIKKDEAEVAYKGAKKIIKYTAMDKKLEINHMILSGRTPDKEGTFICETKVHFMAFVIKGEGKMYVGDEVYGMSVGDCVDVPPGTKFAAEGTDFEYITTESPAWYSEQSTIVDKDGNVVER